MPETTRGIALQDGDVLLMVGTTKGAFLFRSDGDREAWEMDGPHFPGEEGYALALDRRRPAGVYLGTRSSRVYASRDDGESWTARREQLPPVTCAKAAVVREEVP